MNFYLTQLQQNDVFLSWRYAESYIREALKYSDGRYNLQDILVSIISKKMQFWAFIMPSTSELKGILVTELLKYPRKKVAHVLLMSCERGLFEELFEDTFHILENWAKSNECINIDISGRFGWDRVLEKKGFNKLYTVMSKDI